MLFVNVERGREEGTALAKKLEEIGRHRDETYVEEEIDEGFREELGEGFLTRDED
jgi:hypothetical protein